MTIAYSEDHTWHRPISTPKAQWLPSTLILAIVFISFRPFAGETTSPANTGGGDVLNQVGFGVMGLVCGVLLFRYVSSNVRAAFANPIWFLVLGVLLISVTTADNSSSSMRAMIFSLIVVISAATAMALPRNMAELTTALTYACLLTLALCYFAVMFVPEQGIHGAGGFESQHAGLWRGVYSHKNVSSYIMGVFFMIGLFVMRNGRPALGVILAVGSLTFVIYSGSKTVLGILPIAIATALAARFVKLGILRWWIILFPVAGLFMATLGAILFPSILLTLQGFIPKLTYTGRLDLWEFGMQFVWESKMWGYGFESFWGTPRVENMSQPIELSWDVRGIVHGHNSWMDGAIAFGIPGMFLIFIALVVMPIRDFINIPNTGNASKTATLFLSIWIFTILGANLESFFFRRSDPIWFSLLIAVIGLRITAHMTARTASKSKHQHHNIAVR